MPSSVLDFPFDWIHLIASTQVVATRCMLHSVTLNHPATGASTVSLHDVAAVGDIAPANMIANITLDPALFVIPTTLAFDCQCINGLYVLFNAAITAEDITVSYR